MDLFKQQVARVQQQLGGLNASQKMLAFALVVIMVMTLLYWGRYAGNQEMAPLLNQAFAEEDIARITAELQSRGINARVDGDKIVVPADRKMECIAILGYEQLLPRDTRKGFDEMVKQINPFEANGMVEAKLNQGKAITLSQVIGRFPGVREATVVIDPTTERRIGNGDIRPSAMIHASLRGGKRPDQRLIDAMAAVVTGAQSSIGKITIVIDGRSYKPTADEGEDGGSIPSGEMLERVQAAEARLTRKILEYINWIPDPKVAVTVELENQTRRAQVRTYDADNTLVRAEEESERVEESQNTAAVAPEPGVLPNTGMAIAGGAPGGGGSSNTVTESKTKNTVLPSVKDEQILTPAGKPTVVAAAVRVPRSYFVSVWRQRNPNGKGDPDDGLLQPLVDNELPKIRSEVMKCVGLSNEQMVSVETYTDTMPLLAAGEAGTALAASAGAAGVGGWVGGYAKEVGLGALALISLFMVSGMVKKGSVPAPVMPAPVPEMPAPQLFGGEPIAGEVGGGDQTLDGMELDEDAVRAQQMLDQVQTMVKEDPDGAANLVKRWLNRS